MKKYTFTINSDDRGSLVAIEFRKDIPFAVKRVYYIFGIKEGDIRGLHAHKTLHQVMVCVNGSCTIVMDDGFNKTNVLLASPDIGLDIGPRVWHEMKDFSSNAVLLVFASDWYDEDDYIRNYDEFISYIRKINKDGNI